MKSMNPMNKIKMVICLFGFMVGAIFPILVDYFVIWIPERKILFNISCIIAGLIVGMFAYLVVKVVLYKIDKDYKNIIKLKLGVQIEKRFSDKGDILITMEKEFQVMLEEFSRIKKKEDDRLKKLTITDGLTKLYNIRFLETYSKNIYMNLEKEIGILFLDIDYFKNINDNFGHNIGDLVLKSLANIMKEFIGSKGKIIRYGGEEFLVLLENSSLEETINTGEDLRLEIKNSVIIPSCKEGKSVTVSIGIGHFPTHGNSLESIIKKADYAMYNAKKQGRDRCCIYEDNIHLFH